ncbi:MAG: TOBE domain-containing protein [Leptolyngbyaceae cyanobacterium SL_7_1]|nr:TOBE domain-containing protein [Leptolyngbyaceae cyanobacterium SL_7_1]
MSIGAPAPKNLPVRVERVEALGSETYLSAQWDSREPVEPILLNARVDPDRPIALGESLWLSLAVEKIHLFDPSSGEAIVP